VIRAKRPFDASKIKGIVFDKDGTLLDFHGTWMPKLRAAVSELANGDANVALTMLEIVGFDSHQNRVLGGSVLAAGDNRDISLICVAVKELTPSLNQLAHLGLVLGVATMDSEAGIKATLSDFGCLHLFDYAVGYDSGFGSKPGPGMVLGFCQHTGLKPEEVMVVGDNTHDLHMGQSAGVGFNVGVLTGTSTRSELITDADLVLDSIADLRALWA
jgi:phosphoglycolate phosphatase